MIGASLEVFFANLRKKRHRIDKHFRRLSAATPPLAVERGAKFGAGIAPFARLGAFIFFESGAVNAAGVPMI
jgi:hypothetical protein